MAESLAQLQKLLEGLGGAGELEGTSVMEELLLLLAQPRPDPNILCKKDSLRQGQRFTLPSHFETVWPILVGLGRAQTNRQWSWE